VLQLTSGAGAAMVKLARREMAVMRAVKAFILVCFVEELVIIL
jgi:hypothetical protein